MKKTTIIVAMVACLMVAGTANAALVDYVFTVDDDLCGGTLTWDDVAEEATVYSFWRSNSNPGTVYDTADGGSVDLTFDGGGAPLTLATDIDDTGPGADGYFFSGFNFSTGDGEFAVGDIEVTGATLTKVPEPATMSLLAIGGLALLRRRKRRA
jgi:hypothetical protein